jgi:hypothetical protein
MAFEFDSDGFLTDRSDELEASIDEVFGSLLAPARQINRDCHELIFSADVRKPDKQGQLVATLFLRALEHYQATLILLAKGLVAPAKSALRTLMETVFIVRAVSVDEDTMRAFIIADLAHRKKYANKAKELDPEKYREIAGSHIEQLEQKIKITGARAIRVEELSKAAGMHELYRSAYSLLSAAVHSQVGELDKYLKLDGSDEVRELIYGPSMEETPLLTLTAAQWILMAASAVEKTFGIKFEAKVDEHLKLMETRYQALNPDNTS